MKSYLCVCALLLLPACLGGGGSSSSADVTNPSGPTGPVTTPPPLPPVDPNTPTAPSVPMNTEFGSLMNGVRMVRNPGAAALTYDSRVGRAAQQHANDMVINNYFSKTIPGSDNGTGGERDIGNRVTAMGYDWVDIAEMIEQGDYTLQEAMEQFGTVECDADGSTCFGRANFQDFGIAKAGNGSNQKWVLVLAEPKAE